MHRAVLRYLAGFYGATRRLLRRRLEIAALWGAAKLAPPLLKLWRRSMTVHLHGDPRPALRCEGVPYIYAFYHGQQVAAFLAHDEARALAMVSRSRDGELLARLLAAFAITCVRGSTRAKGRDKGGSEALAQMMQLLAPDWPAMVAVDGPRGPPGVVRRGALALAAHTGAAVLPVSLHATRRWRLRRTWDCTVLPWPGTTLTVHFAAPLRLAAYARATPQQRHDWVQGARTRLQGVLHALYAAAQARELPRR